ncbi:MAG: YfhO family protein, partial [Eubacterium sp.]|nr:YfhO family protein [Eubacterium sp.]
MRKRTIYILSFLLPFFALLVGMIYLGVTPFGDSSLLIIDGLHQYMPFFSVLYDKLRGGESLFYTFRTGLGINFLSLYAYYLSSPLNLIILLFKRSQLNMVVSWLIVLKLSLSGLFASIYFTARSKKPDLHVVAVSVAYALNGYMVGYCWNVNWLDAIMILPVILLGIDRLIDGKDGRLYGLALFYALFCNYYIAFMICIFCVIWYLIHEFKSFRQFFFRGIVFALYSFVAAAMAAVILLPAYLGIRETSSGSDMGLPGHGWITGFWDLISRQFDMAYPVTHDNFDGNANLYFGIFAVIFLLLYLMNREIG